MNRSLLSAIAGTLAALGAFTVVNACSPSDKKPVDNDAALSFGHHRHHDLTDFNYVTVWPQRFPNSLMGLTCVLNEAAAVPCTQFMRAEVPLAPGYQPSYRSEFFLSGLPFGENKFEVRLADGAPLAVTSFVVCRRTREVEWGVGADATAPTSDDEVERTRILEWSDGLLEREVITYSGDTVTGETRTHSYEHRATDTVTVVNEGGILLRREIRRKSLHGPQIDAEIQGPDGELLEYVPPCHGYFELYVEPPFADGSCRAFRPAAEEVYAHPGSDMTWRTSDDYLSRLVEYYYTDSENLYRGAIPGGDLTRTRYVFPPTQSTMQQMPGWFIKATIFDEAHERDMGRPGLWRRSMRYRRAPERAPELVGYRTYEYQCQP